MYRGYNHTANGAGEERDHRLPTLQKAMGIEIRQRLQFTVKLSQFFDATIGSKSLKDLYNARQEYLSDGLRTAYQPLHQEQHWVLQ